MGTKEREDRREGKEGGGWKRGRRGRVERNREEQGEEEIGETEGVGETEQR